MKEPFSPEKQGAFLQLTLAKEIYGYALPLAISRNGYDFDCPILRGIKEEREQKEFDEEIRKVWSFGDVL